MTYLTETQERHLRPLIDELPGRRATIPQYPRPRLRGATRLPTGQVLTPPPLPAAAGGATPQVILWPFTLRSNAANTATIAISPPIPGNAVIDKIVYSTTANIANPQCSLQLYVSDDNTGAGLDKAINTILSGKPIWEKLANFNANETTARLDAGLSLDDAASTGAQTVYPIGVPIQKPTSYLKLTASNNAAAIKVVGYIRIVAALTLDQLADFL